MGENPIEAVASEHLLDDLPDPVFVLDAEGTIRFANVRASELTGLDSEALQGLHYSVLAGVAVDPNDLASLGEAIERALAAEGDQEAGTFGIETDHRSRAETEFHVSTVEDGDVIVGVLLTMRDVTERRRYERNMERTSEQLAILNRLLRHDIRNDLNVVTGWAQELRRHLADEEAHEILDRILSATNHSIELTRESRDLVEALERGEKLSLLPVDVAEILTEEVAKAESRFSDAEFERPDETPETKVAANELLGSVFANLLNNAVIHNDANVPKVRVEIEETEQEVRVSIADNGPGIDPRERERVFGPEKADLESPGSGMGLYLVRYLVSEYDGDISIGDSDLGGAVFTVELPRYTVGQNG